MTTTTEIVETHSATSQSSSRWIPALAGYRALAALAVLVFHILSLDSRRGVIGQWTIPLGNAAVTVFFVLSGFLIYRPFVAWAFGDGPPVSWWRFIVRRVSRILPLYWVVLTFYLFVIKRDTTYTLDEYLTAYSLTQNFRGALVFIPPFVAWSLCIELWFSVALPMIAAPLRWLGAWRPRLHRFRIQLVGMAALTLTAIAFREWALRLPDGDGELLWVPAYLDWFSAGLILAVVSHHWSREGSPSWARQAADNPWLLGTLALTGYWAVTQLGLPGGFIAPTGFQTHLQFTLQALVGLALLANATLPGARINEEPGILSTPVLAKLGAYGYGIYLIHSLVIDELIDVWPDINRLLLLAIVLPATVALSAAAYYAVERPASRLVNRYVGTYSAKPLAAGLRQWSAQPPPTLITAAPVALPRSAERLAVEAPAEARQGTWFRPEDAAQELDLSDGFTIVDHHGTDGGSSNGSSDHSATNGSHESDHIDLLDLIRTTRDLEPEELPSPGPAWIAAGGAFVALADTREETTPTHRTRIPDPVRELFDVLRRPWVAAALLAGLSLVTTILAAPGRYVADARFELFTDPGTRLQRMFVLWDSSRDLGRVAEEFWPGVTLLAAAFSGLGLEPWLNQRLLHALLITMAATGAMVLSRTLRPQHHWGAYVVALLYAFGPFSAIYLIPSTLYVSHAMTPWLVVAVIRATRGTRPLVWAGATALAFVMVGNADAPGLVFACVPAMVTWIALVLSTWREPAQRRRIWAFTIVTTVATLLGSAAMLAKTSIGASALALRLIETESVETVAAATSFSETMRGMGLWLNLFRVGPVALRSHQLLFVNNPWGVAITFVPVLAAVLSLIWWRHRANLLALSWIIIGIILAVGPHPVDNPSRHGQMLLSLYDASDLAFGFRSTHKAGTIIALGVAVLGGWALAALATWPARQLRSLSRAPFVAVAAALAMLTQPFWYSPLYDPQFQSNGVPQHWEDLGAWFDQNPPAGRVLVLPGSTNNGYQWGRIGDDLLDPIVPNRVVASTLPLSTLPGADVIRELDRAITSPAYQAGTLQPLARHLGISTIVIRNDLDWQLQGLPPPSNLDALRADPDLSLTHTIGDEGTGGAPPNYPPLEIYELDIGSNTADFLSVTGGRSTIVVDGATPAVLDLAALGLLDQGHLVRYGPELDQADLDGIADDVALVVLGDSLVAEQRRVNHYGYYQAPAEVGSENNPWLPGFDDDAFVWPTAAGATVSSTIDRWLLTSGQPMAASDGNPATIWTVPFLVEGEPQTWSVAFDEDQPEGVIELDVLDGEQRLGWVEVMVDGQPLPTSLIDGRLVVEVPESFRSVEITLPVERPGRQPVGLREIRFDDEPLVSDAGLSTRLVEMAARSDLDAVPVLIRLGPAAPSPSPWQRTISLWRGEVLTFAADIEPGQEIDERCLNDIMTVDGRAVSVRFTASADGITMSPCNPANELRLDAGSHVIELNPGEHRIGMFRAATASWVAGGLSLDPVSYQPVSIGDGLPPGSTLATSHSFDSRWQARIGGQLVTAQLADGLTTFTVPDSGGRLEAITFTADDDFRLALWLSLIGLLIAGLALTTGRWTERWFLDHSDAEEPSGGRKVGLPRVSGRVAEAVVGATALAAAYWFAGPWGVAGAVATAALVKLAGWRLAIAGVGLGIVVTAAITVEPTLSSLSVRPTDADNAGRVVVGALVMVLLLSGLDQQVKFDSTTGDVDDAVPAGELP